MVRDLLPNRSVSKWNCSRITTESDNSGRLKSNFASELNRRVSRIFFFATKGNKSYSRFRIPEARDCLTTVNFSGNNESVVLNRPPCLCQRYKPATSLFLRPPLIKSCLRFRRHLAKHFTASSVAFFKISAARSSSILLKYAPGFPWTFLPSSAAFHHSDSTIPCGLGEKISAAARFQG